MAELKKIALELAAAHRDPTALVDADGLHDLTREQAYTVQHDTLAALGDTPTVFKVALPADGVATSSPIPSAMVADTQGTITLGGRAVDGLEIEIAARLSKDITAQTVADGVDAVLDAIDHFVVGVELLGTRFKDKDKASAFARLADLMTTGGYVIGKETLAAQPDVAGLPVTLSVDGKVVQSETARYPFTDALTPIMAAIGTVPEGFRKGSLVTTGSLSPLLMSPPKGEVSIKLGDFAPIVFRLA
ncbi:fumarylacetoacetate hydrolase family protein [Neorhizobium sp. NCHU2750]|uniref:fumarylacetoacetate hydrolase family protein n=1 Tax=Neorhizobium sp. NCHU2750 TaxID=1825976 RepID=UPI000E720369|nr:hypothetical protein NCHU2750_18340 [Neorhizobium sp. NCHU2750]